MLVLKLAWRSFVRHKRRSIITAAAIALGLGLMLAFIGLADDAHRRMADMGIRMGSGHVTVQGRGYQDEQTIDYLVKDPQAVLAAARELDGVALAVPRLRSSGLVSTGENSAAVAVSGVDPHLEPQASTIASPRKRLHGDYLRTRAELEFENQPGDIYIGSELAAALELEVGDRVVLTVSPRGGGKAKSAAFNVRGIFRTGMDELDSFYVEIDIAEADALLETGGGVTQVSLIAEELTDADRLAAELDARLSDDGVEVLTWKVVLAELYEGILLDDIGLYLMMAIVFVIVALGIFNTVMMSVVERTRELGVMMAVGTSGRRLFATVVAESLVLALVASTIGLAIGLSIHWWLSTHGIDVTSESGHEIEMAGMVFEGRIYSYLTAWTVAKWTLVVIGIVVASAIYPAIRAARLQPVEAMRHA